MGLEEVTAGAVLSQSDIIEYGLEPELRIGNDLGMYKKNRTRLFLEEKGGKYYVAVVYELPKLGL